MATVQIDNEVINAIINNGESLTVPAGQVWKVNVSVARASGEIPSANLHAKYLTLNGVTMSLIIPGSGSTTTFLIVTPYVLQGGDVVSITENESALETCRLNGFRIK